MNMHPCVSMGEVQARDVRDPFLVMHDELTSAACTPGAEQPALVGEMLRLACPVRNPVAAEAVCTWPAAAPTSAGSTAAPQRPAASAGTFRVASRRRCSPVLRRTGP